MIGSSHINPCLSLDLFQHSSLILSILLPPSSPEFYTRGQIFHIPTFWGHSFQPFTVFEHEMRNRLAFNIENVPCLPFLVVLLLVSPISRASLAHDVHTHCCMHELITSTSACHWGFKLQARITESKVERANGGSSAISNGL